MQINKKANRLIVKPISRHFTKLFGWWTQPLCRVGKQRRQGAVAQVVVWLGEGRGGDIASTVLVTLRLHRVLVTRMLILQKCIQQYNNNMFTLSYMYTRGLVH